MNIEEFGRTIKTKYPQYSDKSDFEVGQKMLRKYPQYKNMITVEIPTGGAVNPRIWDVFKELPKATLETKENILLKGPAKFVASTAELMGKGGFAPTQQTYNIPGLEPFKSFQSDFETLANQVIEGKKSLWDVVNPLEIGSITAVPLAGLETAGLGKAMIGDITLTGPKAGEVTAGLIPKAIKKVPEVIEKVKTALTPENVKRVESFVYNIKGQLEHYSPEAAEIVSRLDFSKAKNVDEAAELIRKNLPPELNKLPEVKQSIDNWAKTAKSFSTGRRGERLLEEALDVTKPVLKKKEIISAFEEAGRPGGVTTIGKLKKIEVKPSSEDLSVAESVKGIVKSNRNPVDNLRAVNESITDISENEVTPLLKENPAKINYKSLDKKLGQVNPPTLMKADKTLENTFNLVKQRIMEVVKETATDNFSLWEARKDIDKMMQNEFGEAIFNPEKNSAVKSAYLQMRRVLNEEIATMTPNSGDNFLALMKDLANKYSARQNIAENSYKLLTDSILSQLMKQYPALVNILKALGAVGGFGIGGVAVGVGKKLLGK